MLPLIFCALAMAWGASLSGCVKPQVYIPPEWRKPLPPANPESSAAALKAKQKAREAEQESAPRSPIVKPSPKFEERDISAPPPASDSQSSQSPAPATTVAPAPAPVKSPASGAKASTASAPPAPKPASPAPAPPASKPAAPSPPQPAANPQPSIQPAEPAPEATSGAKAKAPETPAPVPKTAKAKIPEGPQRHASMHLVNTAKTSMAQGNPDQAIPLLEQAIQVDVYNGDAFFELARAWKMKGSPKRALEFARKAEVLYQDDPQKLKQVLLFEAEACKESGDSEKAKSYRQKAQKL